VSKLPDGFSIDPDNSKFRRYESGYNVLEYSHEGDEITVDWVRGTRLATMLNAILAVDGAGVSIITGYVSDKLGEANNATLIRFANRTAHALNGEWSAEVKPKGRKRYLILTREGES